MTAHPRSRGENSSAPLISGQTAGSSPLTRGKPCRQPPLSRSTRLIPAHAGKTRLPGAVLHPDAAHPRSRGENRAVHIDCDGWEGSSPLTRGKHGHGTHSHGHHGLIPAHAGKTAAESVSQNEAPAHPRSRGENDTEFCAGVVGVGSSPLTRGKRVLLRTGGAGDRLIPAHAGKTHIGSQALGRRRAHPRSRGENPIMELCGSLSWGSSPLTRGKLDFTGVVFEGDGLIPAHAGKTLLATLPLVLRAAHPRSRGENSSARKRPASASGSSPLTRGKRA